MSRVPRRVEQRGDDDCLRACLASVLDVGIEAVPEDVCAGRTESQHNSMQQFLATRGLVAWTFGIYGEQGSTPKLMFGGDESGYHLFPTGLWLASVRSPRNDDDHVVVMQASEVVWDPHPRREMGHRGFTEAIILMPRWRSTE